MTSAAIQLAPNVYRIPTMPFDSVNSFALLDEDGSVTLVDTGLRRAPARIAAGLAQLGRNVRDVRQIILTHAHSDHAGGALELARLTGGAPRLHGGDVPLVRAGRQAPPDPDVPLGRLLRRLVGGRKMYPPFVPGPELTDGELLDVAGGLRVIHTPGHSPGHVSLLHEPTGVLITGDAIFNVLGLRWPVKQFCADFALTKVTAHRLGELEYSVAAFTHGPHISERARERVRSFLTAAGG